MTARYFDPISHFYGGEQVRVLPWGRFEIVVIIKIGKTGVTHGYMPHHFKGDWQRAVATEGATFTTKGISFAGNSKEKVVVFPSQRAGAC